MRPFRQFWLDELRRIPLRNCLKSPEGASNVASQGIEAVIFGTFGPLYTGQIHVRSVARTPFQTVSLRRWVNRTVRRGGPGNKGPALHDRLMRVKLPALGGASPA